MEPLESAVFSELVDYRTALADNRIMSHGLGEIVPIGK